VKFLISRAFSRQLGSVTSREEDEFDIGELRPYDVE